MDLQPVMRDGALISPARLMTSTEVTASTANHPGLAKPLTGWHLCGDITREMFDILKLSSAARTCLGFRLTSMAGPCGGHYAIITQQVYSMQHRFLLPLYEPNVIKFFQALEHEPFWTMLGRQGEEEAMVLPGDMVHPCAAPVAAICQPTLNMDEEKMNAELSWMTKAWSRLDSIPSVFSGIAISSVSFSVVPPVFFYARTLGLLVDETSGTT